MIKYLIIGIIGFGCLGISFIFKDGARFSKIFSLALNVIGWIVLVIAILGMLSKNTGFLNLQ